MPDLEQVDVRHGGQQLHVIELVRALGVPPRLVTGGGGKLQQRTERRAQNIIEEKCIIQREKCEVHCFGSRVRTARCKGKR